MTRRLFRAASLTLAVFGLAGCGNLKVWPFADEPLRERSRVPANAVEYQCAGGARFHVRWLDGGGAAWLILPDREVRLDKSGAAGRFGNGVTTLQVDGGSATLADRTTTLSGCKTATGN